MEIEVFRAGSAAANAAGITAADLADVAAHDCAAHPVPNVLGHPKTDSPAHGAVVKFRAEGNSLFADVPETSDVFKPIVDGIRQNKILSRSMAFFGKSHPSNPTPGKLAPKHLGFLGGAAPGIPGMPPLAQSFAFSADDALEITGDPAPAVVFEAAPTAVITFTEAPANTPAATQEPAVATEPTDAEKELAERIRQQDEREQQFAAREKSSREAANTTLVKSLVTARKVLPADEANLVAAFNAVDGGEVIAFASDANKAKASPVTIIAEIIARGGDAVPAADGSRFSNADAPAFAAAPGSELEAARAERMKRYNK